MTVPAGSCSKAGMRSGGLHGPLVPLGTWHRDRPRGKALAQKGGRAAPSKPIPGRWVEGLRRRAPCGGHSRAMALYLKGAYHHENSDPSSNDTEPSNPKTSDQAHSSRATVLGVDVALLQDWEGIRVTFWTQASQSRGRWRPCSQDPGCPRPGVRVTQVPLTPSSSDETPWRSALPVVS